MLGTTLEVTREALEIGSDVLQFAPVAGLGEAARVLVNIWDAVQLVEVSSVCGYEANDLIFFSPSSIVSHAFVSLSDALQS